jgi:hypothetical protein
MLTLAAYHGPIAIGKSNTFYLSNNYYCTMKYRFN